MRQTDIETFGHFSSVSGKYWSSDLLTFGRRVFLMVPLDRGYLGHLISILLLYIYKTPHIWLSDGFGSGDQKVIIPHVAEAKKPLGAHPAWLLILNLLFDNIIWLIFGNFDHLTGEQPWL